MSLRNKKKKEKQFREENKEEDVGMRTKESAKKKQTVTFIIPKVPAYNTVISIHVKTKPTALKDILLVFVKIGRKIVSVTEGIHVASGIQWYRRGLIF